MSAQPTITFKAERFLNNPIIHPNLPGLEGERYRPPTMRKIARIHRSESRPLYLSLSEAHRSGVPILWPGGLRRLVYVPLTAGIICQLFVSESWSRIMHLLYVIKTKS
jgi:hypothetical protein